MQFKTKLGLVDIPNEEVIQAANEISGVRSRTPNSASIEASAQSLANSHRGRDAMRDLLKFLENEGLSLDGQNRANILCLLHGAFGSFAGSAREAMREAIQASKRKPSRNEVAAAWKLIGDEFAEH